jgi:hypothetical protein
MKLNKITTLLATAAISSLGCSAAIAQTYSNDGYPIPIISYPEILREAFFSRDGDIWKMHGLQNQAENILGFMNFPGSFPDKSVSREGRLVNAIWTEMMERQVSSDPVIRTPDLVNPFNTSLRQNPSYIGNNPIRLEGELVYDGR